MNFLNKNKKRSNIKLMVLNGTNNVVLPSNSLLPEDFNWKSYILINSDIRNYNEKEAINHYLKHGINENREYILYDIGVILHIGNIDVFYDIYNSYRHFFSRSNIMFFITVHNSDYIDVLNKLFQKTIISVIPNKGQDIGGYITSIKNVFNYRYYKLIHTFYFIHTKTDRTWRNKMLSPLLKYYNIIENHNHSKRPPIIIGSYDNTLPNKVVNRNYINEIFYRNFVKNGYSMDLLTKHYDEYIIDFENQHDKDIFIFNPLFYKYHEADMANYNVNEIQHHYNDFGKYEFHRIPNPCFIKKHGLNTNFIAGTIFSTNLSFIEIFRNINLDYEFEILEEGYVINDIPRKNHSWEYFFGLMTYMFNGYVLSIKNKGELLYKTENTLYYNIQSVINIDPLLSKIAFFILIPTNDSLQSGGYRTLINYIKVLEINGIYVDIYFGNSIEDMKLTEKGLSVVNSNIHTLISYIDNFKILDISKHNFFLGLNCQRKYDVIVANAWQVSESVYLNKEKTNKLAYIIQDEEKLFYPNNIELQTRVLETYKPEYNYYCLSKYLYNIFSNTGFNCVSSFIGVNLNTYRNLNYNRDKTVIIAYYRDKVGRLSKLIESLIDIISKKCICYIFPHNYYSKTHHPNIVNIGAQTVDQLNEIYNKCKVGIVMSNTNPSRLGYEMLASGLRIIEYDSKYTEHDMPNNYFHKIKNSDNIMTLIDHLMNDTSYDYPIDYINDISIDNEYRNVVNFFNSLL
jgi:hypothetical protein